MNRKTVILIFTLLYVFLSIPSTAFGDNSLVDHQNVVDDLEEMSQIYRRFVSVKANEDCSSFTIVINDAANWGRAEEIAESQLFDYAQRHANSGSKNDIIGIHYMNMNGDEVYYHSYNGSVVLATAAEAYSSSDSMESTTSNGNIAGRTGNFQNTYDELEDIAQTYRRFVSVKANEDCSSFSVVINDAANWGRAEEIAEAQLYDYAQKHANSGNKNDIIGIHYMNMNGDEVYFHNYNGSVVITTTATENYSSSERSSFLADSSSTNLSSAVLTDNSITGSMESGTSNGNPAENSLADTSTAAITGSSAVGSSESNVSGWHLADNSSANSSGGSSQGIVQHYVLNTRTNKFHLPSCRDLSKMKEENRVDVYDTKENLIEMCYDPCGHCNP